MENTVQMIPELDKGIISSYENKRNFHDEDTEDSQN
jgi:hypothetical protein